MVKAAKTVQHIIYFDLQDNPFRRDIDLISLRDFYVNWISTLNTREKHSMTLKIIYDSNHQMKFMPIKYESSLRH